MVPRPPIHPGIASPSLTLTAKWGSSSSSSLSEDPPICCLPFILKVTILLKNSFPIRDTTTTQSTPPASIMKFFLQIKAGRKKENQAQVWKRVASKFTFQVSYTPISTLFILPGISAVTWIHMVEFQSLGCVVSPAHNVFPACLPST